MEFNYVLKLEHYESKTIYCKLCNTFAIPYRYSSFVPSWSSCGYYHSIIILHFIKFSCLYDFNDTRDKHFCYPNLWGWLNNIWTILAMSRASEDALNTSVYNRKNTSLMSQIPKLLTVCPWSHVLSFFPCLVAFITQSFCELQEIETSIKNDEIKWMEKRKVQERGIVGNARINEK